MKSTFEQSNTESLKNDDKEEKSAHLVYVRSALTHTLKHSSELTYSYTLHADTQSRYQTNKFRMKVLRMKEKKQQQQQQQSIEIMNVHQFDPFLSIITLTIMVHARTQTQA